MLMNVPRPVTRPPWHLAHPSASSTSPSTFATRTLSSLEQYGLTSPTGTMLKIATTWLEMSLDASLAFLLAFSHLVEPAQLLTLSRSPKLPEALSLVSLREKLRSIRMTLTRKRTDCKVRSNSRMSRSITQPALSLQSWLTSLTSLKLARRLPSLVHQARARAQLFSLLSVSMTLRLEKF